ncbi:DUF6274 family protein [Streptomyces cinerochromogenes]|uniref:DUF6274 family protein n=1 Tax=Streptomyces cinerochromogenes TaxID=66422 RepID=UPI001671453F|nr:DUF6274 family protein [Streptomyces cinerochromogenes]GGS59624.1 hypothetical protein GCM10010206_22050 [Streptomyces cinerochromogenes]
MTASVRHETRALLRAHLSAASSYRHLTRHCPICHRLLRLAMDAGPQDQEGERDAGEESGRREAACDSAAPTP